jgi:hypothetical protein
MVADYAASSSQALSCQCGARGPARALAVLHAPLRSARALAVLHAPLRSARALAVLHAPLRFAHALVVLHAPARLVRAPALRRAPSWLWTRPRHPPRPSSVAPSVLPTDANHHAHAPSDAGPTAREDEGAPNGHLPIRAGRRSTASTPRARRSRPRAVGRIPRPGEAAGPSLPPYPRNIDEGVPQQRCIRRAAPPARKLLPAWLRKKRVDSYALHWLRMVLAPALPPY